MRIANNVDVSKQQDVRYTQDTQSEIQNRSVKQDASDKAVELSLSAGQGRKAVLTDEELQCALENVMASQSSVYDVQQPEKMIAEANRNILKNAADSVLAQANQTPPMVTELTQ